LRPGILNQARCRKEGIGLAIGDAITKTASPEFHEIEIERLRIKASHDEAQALYNAERRGETKGEEKGKKIGEEKGKKIGEKIGEKKGEYAKALEIAKKLLNLGDPIDKIIVATGLNQNEIESLKDSD